MKAFLRVLPFLLVSAFLWAFVSSCGKTETKKPAEAERVEKEVARRVETIRGEMKTSESRRHTTRVIVFGLLAGGGLLWLLGSTPSPPRPAMPPAPRRYEPRAPRRVIDRGHHTDEPDPHENRR